MEGIGSPSPVALPPFADANSVAWARRTPDAPRRLESCDSERSVVCRASVWRCADGRRRCSCEEARAESWGGASTGIIRFFGTGGRLKKYLRIQATDRICTLPIIPASPASCSARFYQPFRCLAWLSLIGHSFAVQTARGIRPRVIRLSLSAW